MPTLDEMRRMFANGALAPNDAPQPTPDDMPYHFKAFLAAEGQQKDFKGWIIRIDPTEYGTWTIRTSWGAFNQSDWRSNAMYSDPDIWDMFGPSPKSTNHPDLDSAALEASRIIAKKLGRGYTVWSRSCKPEQIESTLATSALWEATEPKE